MNNRPNRNSRPRRIGDEGSIVSEIAAVWKDIMGFIKGLGDQVPDYPIKSKNTLQSIVSNLSANFTDPTSQLQATVLWTKAKAWKDEADQKVRDGVGSKAVNETYSLLLQKIMDKYEEFGAKPPVNTNPNVPGTGGSGGGGNGSGGDGGGGGAPPTQTAGMSTGAMVLMGLLAVGLLAGKK